MTFYERNDIIKLGTDLYVITGDNQARFPFCNAFLITADETVLIDTGIGVEKLKEIDREKRIDQVIISHPHPDHISGWGCLRDRPLMVPKETGDEIQDLVKLGHRFTGSRELGVKWAESVENFMNIEPVREPDDRYGNGDMLDFGSVRMEAVHVPGHLNDHYCFFDHESKTLLTTDIDFTSFGPWYGNPEGEIEPFIDGILKVMQFPYDRVCSSHKPPIEEGAADAFDRFLKQFDRHRNLVLDLCRQPSTLSNMANASPFYLNKLKPTFVQDLFEKNMIKKNLEMLIRDGLIIHENGYYRKANDA